MAARGPGRLVLVAQALVWTLWCLLSTGPIALVMRALALAFGRTELANDTIVAVLIEMLVLGVTAFGLFLVLGRRDAPSWFWVVAPGGYILSFVGYVVLERLANGALLSPTAGTILEVVAVSGIVSAAAYLGAIRGAASEPGARAAA